MERCWNEVLEVAVAICTSETFMKYNLINAFIARFYECVYCSCTNSLKSDVSHSIYCAGYLMESVYIMLFRNK
jgi:hypothetical protein